MNKKELNKIKKYITEHSDNKLKIILVDCIKVEESFDKCIRILTVKGTYCAFWENGYLEKVKNNSGDKFLDGIIKKMIKIDSKSTMDFSKKALKRKK